jgi:predicted unusual protein kinase regulating ubiquinone biosynthesis (AarF/ABC1/UbiB family)
MLIGVGTKDASRVVDAYEKLGMILPSANLELLKKAEAQVFARFWGMSMSELRKMDRTELRQFAHQYRDLMYSMPFQVPQNLIMLGRTVAILSGMCTGLDPNFNLWTQVAPYARKLIEQEATKGLDYWLEQIGELFQTLLALPAQTSRILAQAETGGLTVQVPQISRDIRGVIKSIDRLTSGVVFTALLLGGVFLYNAGNAVFGESLLGLSGLLLLWILCMRRD